MEATIVVEQPEGAEQPVLASFPNGAPFRASEVDFELLQGASVSGPAFAALSTVQRQRS